MSSTTSLYFSELKLEKVQAGYSEGWELGDKIAYCHAGYFSDGQKLAFTSKTSVKVFSIFDCANEKIVYTGDVEKAETELGVFFQMDFSQINKDGEYLLTVGEKVTKPFRICSAPWKATILKTLRNLRDRRCGCDVPGVHLPCHSDCFAVHPDGRRVIIGGGWHSMGDLSHNLCVTAELAKSLIEVALSVKGLDTAFYNRLLEEARIGLEWIQRTRFGDGYRCVESKVDVWTNGIIGDNDDIIQSAHDDPFGNFCAAASEATAAYTYTKKDRVFALYCFNCAKEDFQFAYEKMNLKKRIYGIREIVPALQLNGQAIIAAAELYKATGDMDYIDKAVRFAKTVMDCRQEKTMEQMASLHGFFYDDCTKTQLIEDSSDTTAIIGLALLIKYAPSHPECAKWQETIAAYGEYLKGIADLTQPYCILSTEDNSSGSTVIPNSFMGQNFFGNLISMAKKASVIADSTKDTSLKNIAIKQIEWLLGSNPFACSFVYGEGYGCPPLFNEYQNNLIGGIPSGLHYSKNGTAPAFSMTNAKGYNQGLLSTSSKLLWTIADLY